MNRSACPKKQLPLLIGEQLDLSDADRVMLHLETCHECQLELAALSANGEWWERTRRNLDGIETDHEHRLPEMETETCSIETLLGVDAGSPNDERSLIGFLELLDTPSHPEILGRIDEFEIEQKIGQGGMGIVFRGFDRSLNRPVAIKVMSPHLGTNYVARQRFEREARAAAAVVHPNVVPIYRVSKTKDQPYIAMALADGLSLQDYVTRHGPFDVKDVVRIAIQIASGLGEAHKQGLIHRDIKPANVLMEKDVSRVMITDFGLARAADDVMMTQSGCLAGTPHYMSPEQVTGNELDHRSDLFSLGSLIYFIATGKEPFRAESAFAVIHRILHHVPKPARTINIDIPEVLNRIIERLLEKDPDHRIGSATELEELLTRVLAHLQEPSQHRLPDVRATTQERRRVRRRIGWMVGVAGILLLCFAAWSSDWGTGMTGSDHPEGIPLRADGDEHDSSENEERRGGSNDEHN